MRLAKKYPLSVGLSRPLISDEKQRKNQQILTLSEVTFDQDGWAEVKYFLPLKYDLVIVTDGLKTLSAWWSGAAWDGSKIKEDTKILKWKVKNHYSLG